MIQSLVLGEKTLSNNIIQGPLAGVSSAPFRRLIWRYSQPAFSCTEMISCKTLIYQSKIFHKRFVKKDEIEDYVCFQLAGNDSEELSEATKIVTDYGADFIDLNCGCPVKKIRSKGAGSSLLMQPKKLYQLIYAMKKSTSVPVSIKIRVESSDEKSNREIVKVITDAGADFIVVHGRHWTEHYETPCHYDQIQFFVNELKIPVIGNGDVACVDSLKKMFATGCAGVMISRAGVGQPWLIAKLISELNQKPYLIPSQKEIGEVFIEHVFHLAELLGSEKLAVLQARKFSKYYARRIEKKAEFCLAINSCDNLTSLVAICTHYFG